MSTHKYFHWAALLMMALLTVFFFAACDSKNDSGTGDTAGDTEIAVTATPTTVETNQTSVVEATVSSGGTGVEGQAVYFSVTPSSAGTVSPAYDTTDADGVAATVFTATQSGAVVVQAQVVGSSLSNSVGLSVTSTQGSGTGNIDVSVSESLLLANGHDTSHVTVVVLDDQGDPAPDGTVIKLAAGERFIDVDGNGYWSQGIDTLKFDANNNGAWDSFGLIPSTVQVTGGNGTAVVDYISGENAYTVYIKATVDVAGMAGYGEVSIQLTPNTVLHSIYLASDSVTLAVQSTGGIESSQLRATGYDVNGNKVPEGITIVFAILDGPGGGESLDTLAYGPDTAVTNGQGVATTTIHSGTVSGTVRIRAYSGTVLSNATQVLVAAGPPQHIVVGAQECNVDYWDNVGDSLRVVAVVSDVYLNPVNDSTVVYFSCDEGTMMSTSARTEGGKGIAYSSWFAGNNVPTADGRVMVYAETAGGTVTSSTMFLNTHLPAVLSVSGWQTSLIADGESSFSVWISAVDLNGNYVIGGTAFYGEANILGVSGGTFEDGCYSATDRVKVISSTLDVDNSTTGGNDDGVGAIDWATFWADGGASISRVCSLLTGPAYSANSQVEGPTTAQPGEVVRLSVKVADRWNNPLGDHTMNMTASGGTVTNGSQETDAYGEARGFQWTAPATEGDYNITITDTDPRGSGMLLTHKVSVKAAT